MNLGSPEADIASGVIRCTVGGQAKAMPTLKLAAFEDEWLPSQGGAIQGIFSEDRESPLDLFKLGASTVLDAIVAYDKTNALGGREWLRANADHGELYVIARKILDRHFPFLKDVPTLLQAVRQLNAQAVAASVQERLTNGPSPTGDSPPTPSDVH